MFLNSILELKINILFLSSNQEKHLGFQDMKN